MTVYVNLWVEAPHSKLPPCHVLWCKWGYKIFNLPSDLKKKQKENKKNTGLTSCYAITLPPLVTIGIVVVEYVFIFWSGKSK